MVYFILFCLSPLLVSIDLVRCQDDFNQVEYVGCFSTRYAEDRGLAHNFYPFSWESCVLLCQTKGSRYAGLDQRRMKCYCGSYLAENSKLAQPSDCSNSCKGIRRKSCGGEAKMTVYKLKDDASPRILLTTLKMITYIKDTQLIPLITVTSGSISARIAVHYKHNEIYFNLNSDIVKSQYSTIRNIYNTPSTVISGSGENRPFAVDWVKDKIYYLKDDDFWEANLNGSDQKIVLATTGSQVSRMVIDPYEQKLFYNYGTTLRQYDIINKMETTPVGSSSSYYFPLAVDVHTQAVYGVYADYSIMKMLPGNNGFIYALKASNWGSIQNVAVADGNSLVYTQQSGTAVDVNYKNRLVTVTLPEDRWTSVAAIHEVIQAPTLKVACLKLRCSYKCQYSPESIARCVCPSDMHLDSTGRRCRTVSSHRYSTEEESSSTYDSDYDSDNYSDEHSRESKDSNSEDYSECDEKDRSDCSESKDRKRKKHAKKPKNKKSKEKETGASSLKSGNVK